MDAFLGALKKTWARFNAITKLWDGLRVSKLLDKKKKNSHKSHSDRIQNLGTLNVFCFCFKQQ